MQPRRSGRPVCLGALRLGRRSLAALIAGAVALMPMCVVAQATPVASPPATDLLTVYQAAFEYDAPLKQARADWQAVEALRGQAIAALLPDLTASRLRLENRYDSSPTVLVDTETDYWTVNLKQTLFSVPALHGVGQVNANIAQARALWLQARQDFMIRVADAYFGQLRADSNLAFARAEERAFEQQLDQARQRFSVGLAPIVDVQDARASHSLSIANRLSQAAQRARTSEALRATAGRYYARLTSLSADHEPAVPPEARQWVKEAPQRSPVARAALHGMRAAKKNAKVQNAERWPVLNLDWTYTETIDTDRDGDGEGGDGGGDFGSFFSGAQDGHRIMLTASVPLFRGGAITSRARQARWQWESSQRQYQQARRGVVQQTRSLLLELRIGVSRVAANRQAVIAARSAVDAARAGYQAGTRNLADVLNAQSNLYRASRDQANAHHDFVLSWLRLRQQTGVLEHADLVEVNGWLAR